MSKHGCMGAVLAGLAAGAVTGLFGAGGGMVLVPLLTTLPSLEESMVFPCSVAIILPICLTVLAITAFGTPLPWQQALPYLLGSALGGLISGKWGRKIPAVWLHRCLGLLILWGGYRYLC